MSRSNTPPPENGSHLWTWSGAKGVQWAFPACAVDYSEWPGKVGEPGGYYDRRDILRGALLCCKCFDDHLPYVWADDPDHNPDADIREIRESELPWWVTDVDLPSPPSQQQSARARFTATPVPRLWP